MNASPALSQHLREHPMFTRLSMSLLGFLLLLPSAVLASPTIEFFGGSSTMNALTPRILSTGPESAYFNAALLPRLDPQFTLGMFLFSEQSFITLNSRPEGVDVTDDIYEASVDGKTPHHHPLPTDQLTSRPSKSETSTAEPFIDLGIVSHLLGDKLVFGFFVRIPVAQFQSMDSFFSDEREQFFSNTLHPALRGDRLRMLSLSMALAGNVTDWLSLGAGLSLSLNSTVQSKVYLPDALDQERVIVNSSLEVNADMSPHFSLLIRPSSTWSFTMGVKGPSGQDVETNNQIIFWSTEGPRIQEFTLSTGYQPMSIFVGADLVAWESADDSFRLGAEAVWEHWASYKNRHGESPLDTWKDVVAVALGTRYTFDQMSFSADARYQPSPVPDQIGKENYVDNDRIAIGTGFEAELNVLGLKLYGGVHMQGQILLTRETTKNPGASNPVMDEFPDSAVNLFTDEPIPSAVGLQTNNPGYPGFSSGGFLFGAGVTLRTPL
jgi:long-chain fatty acid transport protein